MEGTEKQITWANEIAAQFIPVMEKALQYEVPDVSEMSKRRRSNIEGFDFEAGKEAIKLAIKNTDASDWIEFRNSIAEFVEWSAYRGDFPSWEVERNAKHTVKLMLEFAQYNKG